MDNPNVNDDIPVTLDNMFPTDFYEHLQINNYTEIKGGTTRTGFLEIWVVNVNGRVFARSWGKSNRSWFTALQQEGIGQLKYGDKVLDVTGKQCTDAAMNKRIDTAYRERYTTPENIPYAEGISQPEYAAYTMEFIFAGKVEL